MNQWFAKTPGKRSTRVLFRFSVSYLLLMLIPLFMAITAYTLALNNAKSQVFRSAELSLSRAVSEVECSMKEMQLFTSQLNQQKLVSELLDVSYPENEKTVYLHSAIENLPSFKDTYGLVKRYYIYCSESGVLINHQNAYTQLEHYYSSTFRYGTLTGEEFRSVVLEEGPIGELYPAAETVYLGSAGRSLLYQGFLCTSSHHTGRVLYYLDEGALIQRLKQHFDMVTNSVGIYTETGVPLLSTNPGLDEEIGKIVLDYEKTGCVSFATVDYLISCGESDLMNVIFVAVIPMDDIFGQLSGIKTTMFTGMGIMLLVGILLGTFLFFHNRRPLAAVIDSLPDHPEAKKTGLWWLEDAVRTLCESREQMEEAVRTQRFALTNAVTNQLIHGGFRQDEEMESQLQYVGIDLVGDWFCGVRIRLEMSKEWNCEMSPQGDLRRIQLMKLIGDYQPTLISLGLESQNTFSLLYQGQGENGVDEDLFQDLYQKLMDLGEVDCLISIGTRQGSLVTLYHSFLVADQQLENAQDGNWLLLANPSSRSHYHFSRNDEQRLTKWVLNGCAEDAIQLLEHLWQENFQKRNITGFERELLYYRILDTILQASGDSSLMNSDQIRPGKMNADEFLLFLKGVLQEACQKMEKNRAESSVILQEKICEYLQVHYTDFRTCLASVAMHFGLTEKYLSAFFKAKVGINFSNYLEDMRIGKAEELLRTTPLTVEEVSEKVGYTNAKTFSRAFCRCTGKTPSQARTSSSATE